MFTKRNNYAFIDSQNLNLSIQEREWKLDFRKFRTYLKDKYGVTKAFIFIGYVATNQSLYTAFEKAVIVTGDGDFYCLIEYLKKQQKLEKLLIPDRDKYSSLLRKFVSDAAFMSDLKVKLEYK